MAKSDTSHHDERIAKMAFGSVLPHYISKIEKKGRTQEEMYSVIQWLTGYDKDEILAHAANKTNFRDFFEQCQLNPNASLITGVICGYRVEEISNETTRQCRYLDKLIDELARGKKLEHILRKPK
jgi:hypothetical protein